MIYTLSAIIEREGNWDVALCPELDVASQGKSIEEANKNLSEAVQLDLETADPKEMNFPSEAPFITTFKIAV